MQVMLEGLKSGAYSALVLDAPVLEYVAGTNEACDLFLVGDVFESFSLALAFPPAFSDATVFAFSQSIVKLQVCCKRHPRDATCYCSTPATFAFLINPC